MLFVSITEVEGGKEERCLADLWGWHRIRYLSHHGTRHVENLDDDQWDLIMSVNLTGM